MDSERGGVRGEDENGQDFKVQESRASGRRRGGATPRGVALSSHGEREAGI